MYQLMDVAPDEWRFQKWFAHSLDLQELFSQAVNYYSSGYDYIPDMPLTNEQRIKNKSFASKKFKHLNSCARHLEYKLGVNNALYLSSAFFCRDRLCLICNWRRRLKYSYKLYQSIYPYSKDYNLLFFTFTAPNVPLRLLSLSITRLHYAFNYLFGYSDRIPKSYRGKGLINIPKYALGSFRTVEVTRRCTGFKQKAIDAKGSCYNKGCSVPPYGLDYHPHLHAVVIVDKNLDFIPHNCFNTSNNHNWVSLWTQALIKAKYPCNLNNLQEGYNKNNPEWLANCSVSLINKRNYDDSKIKKGIWETSKYGFEPMSFMFDRKLNWFNPYIQSVHLTEFAVQIHNRRFLVTNGCLRGCVSDNQNENLVSIKDSDNKLFGESVFFKWNKRETSYCVLNEDSNIISFL